MPQRECWNGTFYTAANTPGFGPIVSDSILGKAFMAVSNYSNSAAVYLFDETSFNLLGSIPINDLGTSGYPTNLRKIVRWGQNGIAVSAVPSSFTTKNQIYIFQSPLVKDVSSSPADLSVSLTAPATATTGTAISYVTKVTNAGPNAAIGATLAMSLDSSLIVNSFTASQGLDARQERRSLAILRGLASGASVTVTANATPANSGTMVRQRLLLLHRAPIPRSLTTRRPPAPRSPAASTVPCRRSPPFPPIWSRPVRWPSLSP